MTSSGASSVMACETCLAVSKTMLAQVKFEYISLGLLDISGTV